MSTEHIEAISEIDGDLYTDMADAIPIQNTSEENVTENVTENVSEKVLIEAPKKVVKSRTDKQVQSLKNARDKLALKRSTKLSEENDRYKSVQEEINQLLKENEKLRTDMRPVTTERKPYKKHKKKVVYVSSSDSSSDNEGELIQKSKKKKSVPAVKNQISGVTLMRSFGF